MVEDGRVCLHSPAPVLAFRYESHKSIHHASIIHLSTDSHLHKMGKGITNGLLRGKKMKFENIILRLITKYNLNASLE